MLQLTLYYFTFMVCPVGEHSPEEVKEAANAVFKWVKGNGWCTTSYHAQAALSLRVHLGLR